MVAGLLQMKWRHLLQAFGWPLARRAAATPLPVSDLEQFPVLSADELFRKLRVEGRLASIERLTGYPKESYQQLVASALSAYAEAVQLLPASQAHHHAAPGGMVVHGLEVVDFALRFRKGRLLPQGGVAEEIAQQEHLWTYAILVGALLHDIGKTVADVKVTLQLTNGSTSDWTPLGEPMRSTGAVGYRVDFVQGSARNYALHTQLAMSFFAVIVPPLARNWLSENRIVMSQLSAYLYGDLHKAGVIGEIVTRADGESVAANLALGDKTKLASATETPLVEKLLGALRYLLISGKLPINRDGAAGWVYDGYVWLLVPRVMDILRQYMTETGFTGIPTDNERLFDILQEHGVLVQTPKERAVWTVIVHGEDYQHRFTAIKIHVSVLYRPREYPAEMVGTVTPSEATPTQAQAASPVPAPTPRPAPVAASAAENPPSAPAQTVPSPAPVAKPRPQPMPLAQDAPASNPHQTAPEFSPAPPMQSPNCDPGGDLMERLDAMSGMNSLKSEANADESRSFDTATISGGENSAGVDKGVPPWDSQPPTSPPRPTPDAPTGMPDIMPVPVKPDVPPPVPGAPPKKAPNPESIAFMQWVQAGLANGELAYNESKALVHFLPEGMLLVSPRIFQAYADENNLDWMKIQGRVSKSGLPHRNPKGGKFVWRCQLVNNGAFLNGFLLDPKPFLTEVPPNNPHLVLSSVELIGGN